MDSTDNEVENNSITVNRREDDTKEEISIEALADEIHSKTQVYQSSLKR